MKPIKLIVVFTALALSFSFMSGDSNAQQAWSQGYAPSCSERGDCPYYDSYREPYQHSFGERFENCGFGGTCGQSLRSQTNNQPSRGFAHSDGAGRCPFEQGQYERANFDPRSTMGGQPPLAAYTNQPDFDARQSYQAPGRRNFESYQSVPADRRPELRSSPSFAPSEGLVSNEFRPQSNSMTVPPTSPQFMPPPQLPPQQSGSALRQNVPPMLPPTTMPESSHDHAGHDHSGHNH